MIYLDHNATSPIEPDVLDAMLPFLHTHFGNAASQSHAWGKTANAAVEAARDQVAALVGAPAKDIVWTSGATESCNLAIKGIARRYAGRGRHLISQSTEHPAVLDTLRALRREAFDITLLPVDAGGRVDPQRVQQAIRKDTVLVSIMTANNETGTLQPIDELAAVCSGAGVWLHTDATQALGRIPVDVMAPQVDLLSASAHKMGGPKGVGLLYIRSSGRPVRCNAEIHGGAHESGMRSGTLNVPAIVGFGAAAAQRLSRGSHAVAQLRDRLERDLQTAIGPVTVHGSHTHRLPNTLSFSIDRVDSATLLAQLPELALSTGAACTSADRGPSHVLRAMGVAQAQCYSSIRASLGHRTTSADVDEAIRQLSAAVCALRNVL